MALEAQEADRLAIHEPGLDEGEGRVRGPGIGPVRGLDRITGLGLDADNLSIPGPLPPQALANWRQMVAVRQRDNRIETKVRLVHAGRDDDLALAVNFFGSDPADIGALAGEHLAGRPGADQPGNFAILGRQLVEDQLQSLGLGVLHRQPERTFGIEVRLEKHGRLHKCIFVY